MTAREARNRRRAEERKEAKLARKAANSLNAQCTANPSAQPSAPVLEFNPEIEDEFPRELQIQANLVRNRVHRAVALKRPHGFVPQSAPQPPKRAEINRLNAQHSTGPTSPEGKLASSRNSLKHGLASGQILIRGEDPAAFDALLHDLWEEYQPASPTEELLVNEMAQSYWLTQRALRFQNECFAEDGVDGKQLALFLRYQTTHDRAFHKALATMLKLKRERSKNSGSGFVPQTANKTHEQSGFLPQNDRQKPAAQAGDSNFFSQERHNKTTEAA